MATFILRATLRRPLPDFARVTSIVTALFDIYAEAQRLARDVDARYPFME